MSLATRARSYRAMVAGETVSLTGDNLTAARVALEADLRRRYRSVTITDAMMHGGTLRLIADIPGATLYIRVRPS